MTARKTIQDIIDEQRRLFVDRDDVITSGDSCS